MRARVAEPTPRGGPIPVVVLTLFAVLLSGCGWSKPAPAGAQPKTAVNWPNQTNTDGYVGSDACRECHSEIYETYQGHPMARSLGNVSSAAEMGGEFRTEAGRRYRVEQHSEQWVHREVVEDADGVISDESHRIAYVLGSGARGRSYLLRRGEVLCVSPIAWYSQRRVFDLSPGYRPGAHPRFSREATDRCLTCHAGLLAPADLTGNAASPRNEPEFMELSVGCERCHGPGERHIAAKRGGSARDTIVNPIRLSPERREAVCAQCHLQGFDQVLRRGRWHTDFRPGERLSDTWTTFTRPLGAGDSVVAVSQLEQLVSSACYSGSDGQLACVSCHDPHRAQPADPELRAEFYRSKCLTCHDRPDCGAEENARSATGDRCVRCHMPRLAASDVPHTSQTDHRILARPAARNETTEQASESPRPFFLGEPRSDFETQRAAAILAVRTAEHRGEEPPPTAFRVLRDSANSDPRDIEATDRLAVCFAIRGEDAEAIKRWRSVLDIQPAHRASLQSLAQFSVRAGRRTEADPLLRRLCELFPYESRWSRLRSQNQAALGQAERAWELAQAALRVNRVSQENVEWAGRLALSQGRRDELRGLEKLSKRLKRAKPQGWRTDHQEAVLGQEKDVTEIPAPKFP